MRVTKLLGRGILASLLLLTSACAGSGDEDRVVTGGQAVDDEEQTSGESESETAPPALTEESSGIMPLSDDARTIVSENLGLPLVDASSEASQLQRPLADLVGPLLVQVGAGSNATSSTYLARREGSEGFFNADLVADGDLVLIVDVTNAGKKIERTFPDEETEIIIVDRIIVVADTGGKFLASGEIGATESG